MFIRPGLFRHLKYVVIDEAHMYRGIFGAHVAHVLRRLVCDVTPAHPYPADVYCFSNLARLSLCQISF
jgi:DEAD/DEAH box helicase domain-containing protein